MHHHPVIGNSDAYNIVSSIAKRYVCYYLVWMKQRRKMEYNISTPAQIYNSLWFTAQKHFSPQAISSPTIGDFIGCIFTDIGVSGWGMELSIMHFPHYWPCVRGIHLWPVNSPHKGQWREALIVSLIWARINGWVNNGKADDLRRRRAHYDVIVMSVLQKLWFIQVIRNLAARDQEVCNNRFVLIPVRWQVIVPGDPVGNLTYYYIIHVYIHVYVKDGLSVALLRHSDICIRDASEILAFCGGNPPVTAQRATVTVKLRNR